MRGKPSRYLRGGHRLRSDGRPVVNARMNRAGFLRGLGVAGAGVAAVGLGMGGVARATFGVPKPPEVSWVTDHWEVEPSGDPAIDVPAVQWAVDEGGVIILKAGNFVFDGSFVVVGKEGNDVEIYGEGNHETKIYGGAPAFVNASPYTDQNPDFIVNHSIDMKIENLDITPYGAFGMYFERCISATIDNCIIRMDPPLFYGYYIWSAAVFFRFLEEIVISGPINVTNNMIYCTGENNGGGILYGNFGDSKPAFTASNNTIEASGPIAASAFLFHGLSTNVEVSYNTIRGSRGTDAIVNTCIDFFENWDASGNKIIENDFRQTIAQKQISLLDIFGYPMLSGQVFFCDGVSSSEFKNNTIGRIAHDTIAGVLCLGNNNTFENNDYTLSMIRGWLFPSSGDFRPGCIFLNAGTTGNEVYETLFPPGTSVCNQVLDIGTNYIDGYDGCGSLRPGLDTNNLQDMLDAIWYRHEKKMNELEDKLGKQLPEFPH